VPIAEPAGPFSVSSQQTLVYQQGTEPAGTQQVVWIDRNGNRGPSVSMPGTFRSLRLSRDGRRLALDQSIGGNADIWIIDLDRGVPAKLTSDPALDVNPRFSPDGKRIVFTSTRSGAGRMFIRSSVSNSGDDEPLPSADFSLLGIFDIVEDWSPDSKYVVFLRAPAAGQDADIWVKPMFGDGKPFPFVQSKSFRYTEPRVSPDSHWLAYTTNETGTYQVVVQRFPDPNGGETPVTVGGGLYPTWRSDGRELYYITLDGKLMVIPVKGGDQLEFGAPKFLFQSPLTAPTPLAFHQYDVRGDGQQFVFIANNTNSATPNDSGKLTVVLNWTATLHKK
jgi:Tol biopolymer transport system component